MRTLCSLLRITATLLLVSAPLAAWAQDEPAPADTTQPAARITPGGGFHRLFLSFIEEATVVENQWWEGRFDYASGDRVDVTELRGVFAFQPWEKIGVGASIGFGNTDISGAASDLDGSGATDLDLWGKYYFGTGSGITEFAAGGILTVPTGDDSAGLGTDAFAFAGFGSLRRPFQNWILSVDGGAQFNADGRTFGVDIDGQTSFFLAGAALFPTSDSVGFVVETKYQSERFDGLDDDWRLLGGTNWRITNRGIIRGAAAFGLTDGAPDWQIFIGYAANL
jgi:hypothetical protein